MTQDKSLLAYYVNGAVREAIPIYPLYAVMFVEHGITPFSLSLLFVIWAVVGLVIEIPSGALADRFSRKWLVIVSGLLKAAAFITWYLAPGFTGYAAGFVIWGIGSSLRSGAWEALLYDLLKAADMEHKFTSHYGRITSFSTLGILLGELSGGFLIVYGYNVVLVVSAIIPIIATIPFLLWVREPEKSIEEQESYLQLLKAGILETRHNTPVRYLFMVTTFLLLTYGIYDEYIGPYLLEAGFDLATIAFLGAGILLATSAGEFAADRFEFFSSRGLLISMTIAALALLTSAALSSWWIPLLIAFYCFLFGMTSIQYKSRLQGSIEGQARATVTSVVALGESVGAIIWFLVFGYFAEISMSTATAFLAVATVVLCVVFHYLALRWRIS